MTTLETLKAARKKIEKPENWTQGELARSAKGNGVRPESSLAVCWCASGAMMSIDKDCSFRDLAAVIDNWIPVFNDTHTHSEVLAAFDAAISKLEVTA